MTIKFFNLINCCPPLLRYYSSFSLTPSLPLFLARLGFICICAAGTWRHVINVMKFGGSGIIRGEGVCVDTDTPAGSFNSFFNPMGR